MHQNILFYYFPLYFFLVSMVSDGKTAVIEVVFPIRVRRCFSLTVFNVFFLCFSPQKFDYNMSAVDFFVSSSGGALSFLNLQIYAFYQIWEVFIIIVFLSLFRPFFLFWNINDRNTKSLTLSLWGVGVSDFYLCVIQIDLHVH